MKLTEIPRIIKEPVDIFICSASFEKRCLQIPMTLKGRTKDTIILFFEEPVAPSITEEHKNTLLNLFRGKNKKIALHRNNPIKTADNIIALMNNKYDLEKTSRKKILLDFSTISRETLLIFLKWLFEKELAKRHQIQLIYNSAGKYSTEEDQDEKKWLTEGIGDLRSVLGYSGLISPSKKLHLVIQVGFEIERALKHIEAYEPSITSLGRGGEDCSICPEHFITNKIKHQKLKDGSVDEFQFSCVDPIQTKNDLAKQIDKYKDANYNVVIAPLNTKISTIGAALLAYERQEIQICYATANIYNVDNYAMPSDEFYLFNLEDLIRG